MLPLIFGILIGAGITRNKAVFGILIAVMIIMVIKQLLIKASKIKVSKNVSKKKSIGIVIMNWYLSQIEQGFTLVDMIYDKIYSSGIILVNLGLFISWIVFLVKDDHLMSFLCGIFLLVIMTQNQIWRELKNVRITNKTTKKN